MTTTISPVCKLTLQKNKLEVFSEEFAKPFEEKLQHSRMLVEKVLAEHKGEKIYLAYSGGLDSECCLQLFKEAVKDGRVQVIVGDTLVELPDTRKRWAEAEAELGVKFIYARPERGISFKANSIKYGLPLWPRSGKGLERRPTIKCCQLLKKEPMKKLEKQAKVIILGLRRAENRNRELVVYRFGDYFYSKSYETWRCYPIAYWTKEEEFEFQRLEGFKYSVIYDNTNCGIKGFYRLRSGELFEIRNGCAFCPQSIHNGYLEWLKEYYFKWYKGLIKTYNGVALVRGDGVNFLQVLILKKKLGIIESKVQPCGEPLKIA